ncbi:MAG: phospholipid carrier-dependent glycosyltransferase [Opitutus sp.]|nr:phospholipid carrier-dependent glycosyltransferase [Opitutus sp.]
MTVTVFAAVFSAWLIGGLIVAVAWPHQRSRRADLSLILPLGAILGFGATSVSFFVASLVSSRPAVIGGVIEFIATAALLWRLWRRPAAVPPEPAVLAMTWLHWALATVFAQGATVAGVVAYRAYLAEPYGGWDGWAIWNLHARFLLRAGTAWPELLSAPQLSWTHPDYPLLVPASVARAWAWAGAESSFAAALVSVGFALASVALLMAIVARQRGRTPALLGGLLLIGTPFFVTFSSNEHADIPLATFMLAAVALVLLAEGTTAARGLWALAGVAAGFAAWTKNEGLLFAVVFGALVGVWEWRRGSRRNVAFFLGGLAVGLLPVVGFKLFLAPANDLMSAPIGPRLAQLFGVARHRLILASLWRDLGAFGEWRMLPFPAMVLPFFAWRWRRALAGAGRTIPALLALMLAGYYGVYLLSPQDLTWHLDTSLVRLLLQLWPLALLGWGLAIPADAPAERSAARQRITPVVFVVANTLAAIGIVAMLAGQLAANELAVKRDGRATVTATLGDGWFAPERHGRDTWAWSGGDANLQLHTDAKFPAAPPVLLRFALRSLGSRTVTVRSGERVLWQGAVGEAFVVVEIRHVILTSGTTTLNFMTDVVGIPESSNPGARRLAFALYNVTLE